MPQTSKTATVVVRWEADPVDLSADDLLTTQPARSPGPDPTERDEATQWLTDALADGRRPAQELFAEAAKDGITAGTLKRAKRELDVIAKKGGWKGGWSWGLPGHEDEQAQAQITCAPSGEPAPLRENKGLTNRLLWEDSAEGDEGAQVPDRQEPQRPSSWLDPATARRAWALGTGVCGRTDSP